MVDRDRQAGDFVSEVEVTSVMVEAGREAFDRWMDRWDYLSEGLPGEDDVGELLRSVFSAMAGKRLALSR